MTREAIIMTKPLYMDRATAATYLAISESLLEMLVAKGDAPKPRKVSQGRAAWLTEELDEWGRQRPVSDMLPPKNSGYGRAGKPKEAAATN